MPDTQPTREMPRMITQSMIPNGEIKPRHLAAATTQAAGDLYFTNAQGIFQRLAPGTNGQTLKMVNGLPAWA